MNAARLTLHLDDHLIRRLEIRAAANGRSVEAEHRAILEAALRSGLTGREMWRMLASGAPADIDFETGADQTPRQRRLRVSRMILDAKCGPSRIARCQGRPPKMRQRIACGLADRFMRR